jgi:hypothetical protein
MLQILNAFTRVRVAAEDFMDARDLADLGWVEESVTDVAVHAGLPEVRVVQFNRQQEGRAVGADYLWWWLAQDSSECFGMLVQAKRLRHESGRWTLDIGHREGKQLGDLRRTANHFEVPAMFAVYTGGRVFRRDLRCFHGREARECLGCRRMAISVTSAYELWDTWESPGDTATMFLNYSIALEDLVDPELNAGKVWDVNLPKIGSGELRDFLMHEQRGPREIAKRIFKAVAWQRAMAFAAALAEPVTIAGDPIFSAVPMDRGHYPSSYFEHFLRGLRTSPPTYVLDAQAGRAMPSDVVDHVAGLVLVSA